MTVSKQNITFNVIEYPDKYHLYHCML